MEVPRRVERRGLRRLTGGVLELFLLFAAASSTQPVVVTRHAPSKALGACSAVTAADLEPALGRRFGRGQEESHAAESTCDYGAGNGRVSITIHRLNAKVDIAAEIESLKTNIPDATVRLISGLGSAAFFLDIAGAGTQLHALRDDRDYVMVSILGFGDAAAVSAAAERLARTALGRI
jgi:hypothetical protein